MARIKNPFTGKKHSLRIPILDDLNQAKKISTRAKERLDAKVLEIEQKRQETQDALELFGRAKIDVCDGSLRAFVMQLDRLEDVGIVENTTRGSQGKIAETPVELQAISFKRVSALRAVVVAGGVGSGSAAVAFAAVGSLASASTGTAIASLSGAAATNATLAFLGGGSLAAGGLGVAGGIAVLGGLVAVPLLVAGGLIFNSGAKGKLHDATEDAEKVRLFIKESDKAIAVLTDIKSAAFTLKNFLVALDQSLRTRAQELASLVDAHSQRPSLKRVCYLVLQSLASVLRKLGIKDRDWMRLKQRVSIKALSNREREWVLATLSLAHVIKSIVELDLIDEAGLVSSRSSETLLLAERILQEPANSSPKES